MKKFVLFSVLILALVFCFNVSEAFAEDGRIEEIIKLLLTGQEKKAMKEYLYFDGTTLWILIACFGLAFGMVSLSSSVAKHFVGAGAGNGEAGQMAYQTATKMVGAGVAVTGLAGRAAIGLVKAAGKEKNLESERSAGNKTWEGPSSGQQGGNGGSDAGKVPGQGGGSDGATPTGDVGGNGSQGGNTAASKSDTEGGEQQPSKSEGTSSGGGLKEPGEQKEESAQKETPTNAENGAQQGVANAAAGVANATVGAGNPSASEQGTGSGEKQTEDGGETPQTTAEGAPKPKEQAQKQGEQKTAAGEKEAGSSNGASGFKPPQKEFEGEKKSGSDLQNPSETAQKQATTVAAQPQAAAVDATRTDSQQAGGSTPAAPAGVPGPHPHAPGSVDPVARIRAEEANRVARGAQSEATNAHNAADVAVATVNTVRLDTQKKEQKKNEGKS